MNPHLLAISIGPVQDFIAAARRTRDLWFGSDLLSSLSKAAARELSDAPGVKLIFPAPNTKADLDDQSNLNVANILFAEVKAGCVRIPQELAHAAKLAVQKRWKEFAESVYQPLKDDVDGALWKMQVDDVIEFYASWTEFTEVTYQQKRHRVMRLLAGRKNLRDFKPAAGKQGVPKSSLDGARESVLKRGLTPKQKRKLNLSVNGEELDAVGLTKRHAGGMKTYPSVARLAADPWLRRAQQEQELFGSLLSHAQSLVRNGIVSGISNYSQFSEFPVDGTAIFTSRYPSIAEEAGCYIEELEPLGKAVKGLADIIGQPFPYLVLLQADGDRMGSAISTLQSSDEHRQFSRTLSTFAQRAHKIVQENHHGACIYTGGDDVLALLPLDKALAAARELRETFCSLLKEFTSEGGPPTLSVGLAIGHFMEPLEDLRSYALEAEKAAKKPNEKTNPDKDSRFGERNGLAIAVHSRGGSPFIVREQWAAEEDSLDKRLAQWSKLFAERALPNKLPYDLHKLAQQFANWTDHNLCRIALPAEAIRLLKKKATIPNTAKSWVEARLQHCTDSASLKRLAEELLAAQWLSGLTPDRS